MTGAVDQSNIGNVLIEYSHRILPHVQGVKFTANMKNEMAATLRTMLEQKMLVLPNNKKLITQLNGLIYHIPKTGNTLFESPEKDRMHDDYLWALALAGYAGRVKPSDPTAVSSKQTLGQKFLAGRNDRGIPSAKAGHLSDLTITEVKAGPTRTEHKASAYQNLHLIQNRGEV